VPTVVILAPQNTQQITGHEWAVPGRNALLSYAVEWKPCSWTATKVGAAVLGGRYLILVVLNSSKSDLSEAVRDGRLITGVALNAAVGGGIGYVIDRLRCSGNK
jgi:hypothetical protein